MKNYVFLTALIALIIMQTTISSASPVFFSDLLGNFGNDRNTDEYRGGGGYYRENRPEYSRRGYSRSRYSGDYSGEDRIYRSRFNRRPAEKPRGRTFNEICRVFTPVNYLTKGQVSVPFCPNT